MPTELQQGGYPYRQLGCFCDGVSYDIPKGYEDIKTYNCSMAHKLNHSFDHHALFTCVSMLVQVFLEGHTYLKNSPSSIYSSMYKQS